MEKILIVDDDPAVLKVLTMRLEAEKYSVMGVTGGDEAFALQNQGFFDLALIDYQLKGETGIQLMEKLHGIDPDLPVIMLTAYGTIKRAVEAIQKGAHSFLTKPFKDVELMHQVKTCLEKKKLVKEVKELRGMLSKQYGFDNIIGRDKKMKKVLKLVVQAADTDSNVFIQGESGTGKELIAKTLHVASSRRDAPFIAVNCGAIPEALFESELFGHKKGAFTGAVTNRQGLLEKAQGGTFFFDEISEIPLSVQAKLLRVIQENEFYPLGGGEMVSLRVRMVAATNTNIVEEVKKGNFREDLYYRIHVIPIKLPPLRERKESIPLLAHHFLNEFRIRMKKPIKKFSSRAMDKLLQSSWPGNIRELKNVVEYSVAMSDSDIISEDLIILNKADSSLHGVKPMKDAKLDFERDYLVELLELTQGNVTKAAKLAGKYRADLYELMKKCGLRADDFRKDL
ncbi:MAG: sigma-54 dependent transcriptional regulator [Desulfobacula sp.]|uniref:sigma-54-dependent transcriptional regulator n=1 Tax=Desulfobacula sp. TaxID=2593537 RepID=UPI0025BC8839|nr:sigma-54 dependent transcriptional regulator [Desulfobacula sp.]MCD4720557.1 sigma-54 dependent transcriptional regulator [Desulfobacula sp.]